MAVVRTLLVEDDFLVRMALADALRDEGFEVIAVPDGDQAAAQIDGPDGFDLLLTDIEMPGTLDGIGVAIHARNRDPGIPVVIVTGRPEGMRSVASLEPPTILLHKPCIPEEVITAARRLVGKL